jgi:HEAT repeat protein
MNLLTLIAQVVIILTMMIIALSIFAVLGRYLGDLREDRIHQMRKHMQTCLDGFLSGATDTKTVIRELGRDTAIALGVLLETASRLVCDERVRLRGLFEQFQFPQKEIAALHSRRWPLRVRAATRLGYMEHGRAVLELVKALDDEMLDVRLAAANALAELGAVRTVRPILHALALPAAWPLQRCAEILYGMGPEVIDPLLDFLGDQDPKRQDPALVVSIRVLGMLRVRRAAIPVSGFLHSPNPELRVCSAKALGQMGDAQVVPALCEVLDDPVWEVRAAVAQALGSLGDPGAIVPLEQRLADSAWWVRFNAAQGLYLLGTIGQAKLRQAMTNHADGFARDIGRQVLEEHGDIPAQMGLPA